MDLVNTVRKSGSRGGVNFSWDQVASSSHRENYLGHSLKAPVGRWQQGRDLNWYAKAQSDAPNESGETDAERIERERKEELRRVKEAEEDAVARAMGLPPPQRDASGANSVEVAERRPQMGPASGPPAARAARDDDDDDDEPRRERSRRHEDKDRSEARRRHEDRDRPEARRRHRGSRSRSRSRDRGRRHGHHEHGRRRDRSRDREERRSRRDRSRSRDRERRHRHATRRDRSRDGRRSRSRDRRGRSLSPSRRR